LKDEPLLTFRQLASSVGVGDSVIVYIDLTAISDLYGYQFQVNYNPAKVTASGAFVNTFFDSSVNASIPPSWNASCAAGMCQFAVSKMSPGVAVSGSGALAQITFTGQAAGETALTVNSTLSNKDGFAIAHSTNTGWVQVTGDITINGVVSLQGRATPKSSGTVTIYDQYGYVAPVVVPFDSVTGAWSATVPVMPGYTPAFDVFAAHGLYLSNVKTGVSATSNTTLPTTKLLGGDADNSGKIDLSDLVIIGGAFGAAPVGGVETGGDINGDNMVNILDLVLAGGNYDLTSPRTW
jgi:hypothetical protein